MYELCVLGIQTATRCPPTLVMYSKRMHFDVDGWSFTYTLRSIIYNDVQWLVYKYCIEI